MTVLKELLVGDMNSKTVTNKWPGEKKRFGESVGNIINRKWGESTFSWKLCLLAVRTNNKVPSSRVFAGRRRRNIFSRSLLIPSFGVSGCYSNQCWCLLHKKLALVFFYNHENLTTGTKCRATGTQLNISMTPTTRGGSSDTMQRSLQEETGGGGVSALIWDPPPEITTPSTLIQDHIMNHTGMSSHLRSQTEIDPFISSSRSPHPFSLQPGMDGEVILWDSRGATKEEDMVKRSRIMENRGGRWIFRILYLDGGDASRPSGMGGAGTEHQRGDQWSRTMQTDDGLI